MKTLTIAFSLSLLALPVAAQEYPRIVIRDTPEEQPLVAPPMPSPRAILPEEWDEEEGEADVYYDTVAAENYDDGYDPNAYQQFEGALSPYGSWINDPTYGQIWVPSASVVGDDFSPYATGGYWGYSDDGWTWVSDWDWGWAPFHYGRWIDLTGWGWAWIPGTVWGPGWVSWRCGGGYAGWAPLPPRGVTVGPPRGVRSPWRFTLSHMVGDRHPRLLPAGVMAGVFAKTSVVTSLKGVGAARFNIGPSPAMLRAPVHPVPRQQLGPRVQPRASITPRVGVPLQARPWVRNPPRPLSIPIRPAAPGPRSVVVGNRMPIAPRPYAQPPVQTYRPPAQAYQQPYRAPMPAYRPPVNQAPAYRPPTYQAPAYRPPVNQAPAYRPPTYQAPAYRAAPSYQAPAYRPPTYQAPAYRAAPSYQAPTYHAPAPTYHPPAPAPSYRAPAATHFGGGGGRHR